MSIPSADWVVDLELGRELLEAHAPKLAALPMRPGGEGWDNVTFRLGDELAMRIPRRRLGAELLANEMAWLPVVSEGLPLKVPEPVVTGRPTERFSHPWAVVRWVPGCTADLTELSPGESERFASALLLLHREAPANAPDNEHRGVALETRRDQAEELWPTTFPSRLEQRWSEGLAAPMTHERRWLHGDLHPRNVIAESGRITGLIDWGDLCVGDPATDLASGWMLFGRVERERFFATYGADVPMRRRAAGWATLFAVLLVACGEAAHVAVGDRIVRHLCED